MTGMSDPGLQRSIALPLHHRSYCLPHSSGPGSQTGPCKQQRWCAMHAWPRHMLGLLKTGLHVKALCAANRRHESGSPLRGGLRQYVSLPPQPASPWPVRTSDGRFADDVAISRAETPHLQPNLPIRHRDAVQQDQGLGPPKPGGGGPVDVLSQTPTKPASRAGACLRRRWRLQPSPIHKFSSPRLCIPADQLGMSPEWTACRGPVGRTAETGMGVTVTIDVRAGRIV